MRHSDLIGLAMALLLLPNVARAQDRDGRRMADVPAEDLPEREIAGRDRGFLQSHAETVGAGRLSVDVYQVLGVGLSYGIGDDTQVSLAGVPFLAEDIPIVAQAKHVVQRTDKTIAAGQLRLLGSPTGTGLWLGSMGMVLDWLPSSVHSWHASADVGLTGRSGRDPAVMVQAQLGVSARSSARVAWIAELTWAGPEQATGIDFAPFAAAGVRLTGRALAVDLGLARPLLRWTDSSFPAGVPFVLVSAVFGGEVDKPAPVGPPLPPSRAPFPAKADR